MVDSFLVLDSLAVDCFMAQFELNEEKGKVEIVVTCGGIYVIDKKLWGFVERKKNDVVL